MENAKKTPLFSRHEALGGKMVSFCGWALPTNYQEGIIAEHNATRQGAGMFDVSHMGEILLSGHGAFDYAQTLMTNDISKIKEGRAVYTPMCYEHGGCVDDLLVYPYHNGDVLLVVNAANDDKDYDWVEKNAPSGVKVTHVSHEWGQIALQGPKAKDVMTASGMDECNSLPFFGTGFFDFLGEKCIISKTGYTGELGFEIYMPWDKAPLIWDILLKNGAVPCGLGSRDTLRFEAGLPLYGHEISGDINPIEGGLGFAVKLDKPHFIGRQALQRPQTRRQIGLEFLGRGIPRQGYKVFADEKEVGFVTSGGPSPTTGKNLANCLISAETGADAVFTIEVRGKLEPAKVIPQPFYKRPKIKK